MIFTLENDKVIQLLRNTKYGFFLHVLEKRLDISISLLYILTNMDTSIINKITHLQVTWKCKL